MNKAKNMLAAVVLGVFAAVMAAGIQPTTAYAEEKIQYLGKEYVLNTNGDWSYVVTSEGLVIMGFSSTESYVTVPSKIAGRPVVAIGKNSAYRGKGAFQDNDSMQNVVIPASVTYIDESAFQNCTGLQQVLIAEFLFP